LRIIENYGRSELKLYFFQLFWNYQEHAAKI
jgi:hypothetical protein